MKILVARPEVTACHVMCMCVWVFMALITALVLCARSQDPLMSVLVRRVHVAKLVKRKPQ